MIAKTNKTIHLLILLSLFAISCSDSSKDMAPLTVNERMTNLLNYEGYKATLTKDDRIIIKGVRSKNHLVNTINKFYDEVGKPELKILISKSSSISNRVAVDVNCYGGDYYQSGGVTCHNWLCWGDAADLNDDPDCFEGTCYEMYTKCYYFD